MNRLLALMVLGCSLTAFSGRGAAALAGGDDEYDVKAAFVFQFAKYVEVRQGSGPFVFGVVGQSSFKTALERICAGKTVGDRPISVRTIRGADEVAGCQFVFIPESAASHAASVAEAAKASGVLSIGDTPGFIGKGVMINMVIVNANVRFDVNLVSARAAKVNISSRILKLAREVKQ